MFKILLLIDCDECGHPLDRATVCSDRAPAAWDAELEELMYEAANQGWDFYMHSSRCPQCSYKQALEDREIQQQLPKEESASNG
jgi:hypothetical protein